MKKCSKLLPWIIVAGTLINGIYNCRHNEKFWDTSFIQTMTLMAAVGITYYSVQLRTDQREAKKHVEDVVEKIRCIVDSDSFYRIQQIDQSRETLDRIRKDIQTTNRRLSNYIDVLAAYSSLNIKEETDYIKQQFDEYRTLVDSHFDDIAHLSKSEPELKKWANNISNKCDRIIAKMYSQ